MQQELRILYDNLERQIVVIIHLHEQDGYTMYKCILDMYIVLGCVKQHSDGSSPVTTTNVSNSLFVNIHFTIIV